MSNFEKLFQYLKDNDIEPFAVLVLTKILLNDMNKDSK